VSQVKKIEEIYQYPSEYIFFGSKLEFNSNK